MGDRLNVTPICLTTGVGPRRMVTQILEPILGGGKESHDSIHELSSCSSVSASVLEDNTSTANIPGFDQNINCSSQFFGLSGMLERSFIYKGADIASAEEDSEAFLDPYNNINAYANAQLPLNNGDLSNQMQPTPHALPLPLQVPTIQPSGNHVHNLTPKSKNTAKSSKSRKLKDSAMGESNWKEKRPHQNTSLEYGLLSTVQ